MGRKQSASRVIAKGDRVQVDFIIAGKRYRPTYPWTPNKTNMQNAWRRLEVIDRQIANGTFKFSEEFPKYRFIDHVDTPTAAPTFDHVAAQFLASCGGLEFATRESYRKILASFWTPKLGSKVFADIRYSDLAAIVGGHPWGSNKTRNNVVSVGRRVFDFGYADIEDKRNPAEKLKALRVQRPAPDPYTVDEAETIIAGIRKDWGESAGNYVEASFFMGTRPSELIALQWPDVDLHKGTVLIHQARVMARDKNKTKTSVAREIELNPRALACIKRQRTLSQLAGGVVFTTPEGKAHHDLQVPWRHWQATLKRLGIRYREPYATRHTSVTWNLMIGKPLLWVAEQHGHSAVVMLKVYAKWLKGSTPADIAAISSAMGFDQKVRTA